MIRIGIFGENYENDACALKALLERNTYNWEVNFFPIIKSLTGGQLENVRKLKKRIEAEMAINKLDYVVCMRDLDALPSEVEKIRLKQEWFRKLEVEDAGFFFLVIVEAEAMILADIETFNKKYDVHLSAIPSPLLKEKPKEFLKQHTSKSAKKYQESHALEIFKVLNFEKVYTNHTGPISFKTFVDELNDKINPKTT